MKNIILKISFIFFFLCIFPYAYADDKTIISLMGNTNNLTSQQIKTIITIVKKSIPLTDLINISKEKIQIIYNKNNQVDYFLVYLLSSKNYSFTITKISVTPDLRVIAITANYQLQTRDLQQQPQVSKPACPDDNIEFVSGTPAPDQPTAVAAVQYVNANALKHHYKVKLLIGEEASVENYENWLMCPKLKAFFNVGHGSSEGILLSNGFLSHEYFSSEALRQKLEGVILLFNSCQVKLNPLDDAIITFAHAQQYGGGVTELTIGLSEKVSQCAWDAALNQEPMARELDLCNIRIDQSDRFEMSGFGSQTLRLPENA